MDAVVYLQNPVVGKRHKSVFRNIKNIEVVGDQFQFVIDDGFLQQLPQSVTTTFYLCSITMY